MNRSSKRIFLLSPARVNGQRAQIVMRDAATFELAMRLRHQGVPLGEVFSFMSGLYFRGKLTYAHRFLNPPQGVEGSLIITSTRGLVTPEVIVTRDDLKVFGQTPIDHLDSRYVEALREDAEKLRDSLSPDCTVVLLGSIASSKYVEPLVSVFGEKLMFPVEFVGRGDLSRGGLLLRAAQSGQELTYVPVQSATRPGPRPARLTPPQIR